MSQDFIWTLNIFSILFELPIDSVQKFWFIAFYYNIKNIKEKKG